MKEYVRDLCHFLHRPILQKQVYTNIKNTYPDLRLALNDEVHSKVLLYAPNTVVVSSANFGKSHWHETSVSFRSGEAHDWYVANAFDPLWQLSHEVETTVV